MGVHEGGFADLERVRLGAFELIEPLGAGGMGEVWRGRHRDGAGVAVKVITSEIAHIPEFRAAFRGEVRAVAALGHPHIVHVLDLLEVDDAVQRATHGELIAGTPAMVMELATGGTLADLDQPLPRDVLYRILGQLLEGLSHAHARGVIHRDLKPSNVLMCGPSDARPGPLLCDFGLADWGMAYGDRSIVGTPRYMAPEQLLGRTYGPSTDLYAVGCVAWELATGTLPFSQEERGRPLRRVPDFPGGDVDAGFGAWVGRLLEPDPARRFQSAAEAAAALAPARVRAPQWRRRDSELPSALWGAGLGLFSLRGLPVVGRVEERRVLWDALQAVCTDGTLGLVTLEGSVGVGKSHLARWICERAVEEGLATVFRGGAGGLRSLWMRLLQVRAERPSQVRRAVSRWLRARGVDDPAVCRGVADGVLGTGGSAALALRTLVEAASRRGPVVLWLKDIDDEGVEAVRALQSIQPVRPTPVLIVVTVSEAEATGAVGDLLEAPGTRRLSVGPLPAMDMETLMRGLLRLDATTAAQVAIHGAGNPLFAVQCVGHWVRRGMLELGPGGFEPRAGVRLEIPDALHEVWTATIDGLLQGREAMAPVLERAAVLGRRVDGREWVAACQVDGLGSPRVRAGLLESMLAARLVDSETDGFAFVHPMLRSSLQRRARDAGRLAGHHAACASVLETSRGAGVGLRRGRHLLAAGRPGQAIEPLWGAAEEQASLGLFQQALGTLALHRRALEEADTPPGDPAWGRNLIEWARACRVRGRHKEAIALLDDALSKAREHDWVEVAWYARQGQGFFASERAEHARALQLLRGVVDTAPSALERCRCLRIMAVSLRQAGDLERAEEVLRQVEAWARDTGESWLLGDALRDRGVVELVRGALEEGLGLLDEARDVLLGCGETIGLAQCLNNRAEALRAMGRLQEAEADYRRAMEIQERQVSRPAVLPRINLALLDLASGRPQRAGRWLTEADGLAGEQGSMTLQAYIRTLWLPVVAVSQDWVRFDREVARATALIRRTGLVDGDLRAPLLQAARCAEDAGHTARVACVQELVSLACGSTDA